MQRQVRPIEKRLDEPDLIARAASQEPPTDLQGAYLGPQVGGQTADISAGSNQRREKSHFFKT